jgi:hypothetical protein
MGQMLCVGARGDRREARQSGYHAAPLLQINSFSVSVHPTSITVENYPSRMTRKSEVALKNTFLLKSVIKQHIFFSSSSHSRIESVDTFRG